MESFLELSFLSYRNNPTSPLPYQIEAFFRTKFLKQILLINSDHLEIFLLFYFEV